MKDVIFGDFSFGERLVGHNYDAMPSKTFDNPGSAYDGNAGVSTGYILDEYSDEKSDVIQLSIPYSGHRSSNTNAENYAAAVAAALNDFHGDYSQGSGSGGSGGSERRRPRRHRPV